MSCVCPVLEVLKVINRMFYKISFLEVHKMADVQTTSLNLNRPLLHQLHVELKFFISKRVRFLEFFRRSSLMKPLKVQLKSY